MMIDISTNQDIELLVNTFYSAILEDELLSPFFASMDFDHHKPKMVHFWSFILLDEPGYTTDVTEKHMHMRLGKEHFDQWLLLFNQSVDGLFKGPKADKAKQRAYLVGWTIKSKLDNKT